MTAKVIMTIPFNQFKTFIFMYKGLNVHSQPVKIESQPQKITSLEELVIKTERLEAMGYFDIVANEVI
ncbi:hypothetical protein QN092_21410 (plasmid) [Proteus vulgaris]|uniref:hypothetical protein n=1 Tax=Proteus vulgaris TaxID=585 RepID=UPI0025410D9C|nr:hypothetical protein [Proteus vulgaris]WIF74520.1 hypothetical protein QN092_21410 [Proteus vulgaris]